MAHPLPGSVPDFSGLSQSKTLFLPSSPGTLGKLVTSGKKLKERTLKFADAHAALTWCEQHGANFIFLQSRDPASN